MATSTVEIIRTENGHIEMTTPCSNFQISSLACLLHYPLHLQYIVRIRYKDFLNHRCKVCISVALPFLSMLHCMSTYKDFLNHRFKTMKKRLPLNTCQTKLYPEPTLKMHLFKKKFLNLLTTFLPSLQTTGTLTN